jgi:hypothetical protein
MKKETEEMEEKKKVTLALLLMSIPDPPILFIY